MNVIYLSHVYIALWCTRIFKLECGPKKTYFDFCCHIAVEGVSLLLYIYLLGSV